MYRIKILLTLFVSALLIFSVVPVSFAGVDETESIFNDWYAAQSVNESNVHKDYLSELQDTDEVVDPQTGSLTLKINDIKLPGKDGLDFSLTRIYSSLNSEFGTKKAKLSKVYEDGGQSIVWYASLYILDTSTNTDSTLDVGPYETQSEAEVNAEYICQDLMSNNESVHAFAYNYYYAIEDVTLVRLMETNYIDKYNYLQSRYDLGHGWSVALPSVQIEKTNSTSTLYYYDGEGGCYQVSFTSDTTDSNLEDYQGKDVLFEKATRTGDATDSSFSNGQVTAVYVFIGSDRKKTYFASDGRIIGIKDRLGNKIMFTHVMRNQHGVQYPFLSKITDSIGRTIEFTYIDAVEADGSQDDIKIDIYNPDRSKKVTLTYAKVKRTFYDSSGQKYYEPYLFFVQDVESRREWYDYNVNPWENNVQFDYFDKSPSSVEIYTNLLTWVLRDITATRYEYQKIQRNLGIDGLAVPHRVTKRYDQKYKINQATGTEIGYSGNFNQIDYSYANDHTGYPNYFNENKLPDGFTYSSKSISKPDNHQVSTEFNNKNQLYMIMETANNNEKKITGFTDFDSTFDKKPTHIVTTFNSPNGQFSEKYEYRSYNSWGGLESATDFLSSNQLDESTKTVHTTSYKYDPTYKFVTEKTWYQDSGKQLKETYHYDSLGRLDSQTNANNETTTITYSTTSQGEQVESVKALENGKTAKTVIVYGLEAKCAYPTIIKNYYTNANNQLVETKASKTYDLLLGLVTSETDEKGKVTTYESWDNYGRYKSIAFPAYSANGQQVTLKKKYTYYYEYMMHPAFFTYEYLTNYVSSSDKSYSGVTNKYNEREEYYDGFGNLIARFAMIGEYMLDDGKFSYDSLGRPVSVTDAEGNTYQYQYGPWGKLAQITDPFNNLYRKEYDMTARKQTEYFVSVANANIYQIDASKKEMVLETTWDINNRITNKKAFPNWPDLASPISESYDYDLAGNLNTYTDPENNTKSFDYDNLNRLFKVSDGSGTTEYGYNLAGQLDTITQKDGTKVWVTKKDYDEMGRLVKTTDPGQLSDTFVPNAKGQVVGRKDPNGKEFTYAYDGDKLTQENVDSLMRKYTFGVHPFGVDQIEEYTDQNVLNSRLKYVYDGWGHIKSIEDANSKITNLSYDNAGKQTSTQDPFGFSTKYYYNKNRLEKVQTNGSITEDTTGASMAQYSYYPNGKIKSVTYPKLSDGTYLSTSYTYDKLYRLTTVTNKKGDTELSKFSYTYYNNGNIKTVTDATGTNTYYYDSSNRLTKIIRGDGKTITYEYDGRGNRRTLQGETPLTVTGSVYYSYNVWNQLTSVNKDSTSVSFKYDPNGLRLSKSSANGTTNYYYNLNGKVIAESDGSNNLTANYVWGPDRLLMKKDNIGKQYYYLYNGHGDVIQIVDLNGNIVNSYQYDEWGNILSQNETIQNNFKYTGEILDSETGLYYLRARYYDPTTGRFINKDTNEGDINNPLSLNQFTYVENNPLLYKDPTGHSKASDNEFLAGLVEGYGNQWTKTKSEYEKIFAEMMADAVRVAYYKLHKLPIPKDVKYRDIPLAPPDVTSKLNTLMSDFDSDYKDYSANPVTKLHTFWGLVETGSRADVKNSVFKKYDYYIYNAELYRRDDLGNIFFGYAGKVFGYSDTFLESGAGFYQIYSGTSSWSYYSSWFDDPRDTEMIGLGISIYNNWH